MTHVPPEPPHADHEEIEVQDARQGRPGRRILLILIVSAGAAAILLLGLFALNGPALDASNAGESGVAETRAFDNNTAEGPSTDPATSTSGSPPPA